MKSFDHYSIVIALNHLTDVVGAASQTNLFKDYIMPVFVVLLSAVTAYFIAIRGYRYQEVARNERIKADALNTIILQMQVMQSNLIAIKQNYHDVLGSHPLQRALNIPTIAVVIDVVDFKPNEIAQLLYARKNDVEKYPWMSIASFIATYGNYNQLVAMLNLRNQLDKEVKEKLAPLFSGAGARGLVKIIDVESTLDDNLKMKYVDLTERFILSVDDLVITINDFLLNFPKKASEPLNKKYLTNYVYLNTYTNPSKEFQECLKRCTGVDFDILSNIMKFDKQETVKRYVESSVVITTPKD